MLNFKIILSTLNKVLKDHCLESSIDEFEGSNPYKNANSRHPFFDFLKKVKIET